MRNISFDFDGTIGHKEEVREFAKDLIADGYNVYITTRRYGPHTAELDEDEQPDSDWWKKIGTANWEEVYAVADLVGIKRENIHFCDMEMKEAYFKDSDGFFYLHLDDDRLEVEDINKNTETFCINVTEPNWKELSNQLLNQKK